MIGARPLVGHVLELAIWLSGTETDEQLAWFRAQEMPAVFRKQAAQWALLLGPLQFTIKHPGGERVPPVPPHISGPDVRLVVVEAEVLKHLRADRRDSGFIADLQPEDLQVLRRLTRGQHAKAHPGMPPLPDANCDAIIDAMGPEAAVAVLRRGTGSSLH